MATVEIDVPALTQVGHAVEGFDQTAIAAKTSVTTAGTAVGQARLGSLSVAGTMATLTANWNANFTSQAGALRGAGGKLIGTANTYSNHDHASSDPFHRLPLYPKGPMRRSINQ